MKRATHILPVILAALLLPLAAHSQTEYNHEYDYECEGRLYLSSFPMDTLLSDACHTVVYMLPPTYPGGKDSLNAQLRRTLPPPPSGEEGRLTVSLCINEEGEVFDVSLTDNNIYLWINWKTAIDTAMRTISRWNPARCDGSRTSTCWIPVGLRYSKARGVEVTGTLGDAFPPADPSHMGYYLADPVRLPIITDLEIYGLHGPVRSMEETGTRKSTIVTNGKTRQYENKTVNIHHFDRQGHTTESLVDANNDSTALHHSFYFPDNQGTDTLIIALDEKGDTTLACRFRNWYDCVGNLLVQTLDDGQKKDTIYFRYQFTADSSTREEYRDGMPCQREVFDRNKKLTTSYINFKNGRYHIKQTIAYDENGLESTRRDEWTLQPDIHTSKTKHNRHGDPILIEYYDNDGHLVETRTYTEYKYDGHGNWTACMETSRLSDGDVSTTYVTRRILYHQQAANGR